MGEGFQSDKITLWTNIWLYMYSHPLGYNWGDWGFRVGTGVGGRVSKRENHIVDKHMALYVLPPFNFKV